MLGQRMHYVRAKNAFFRQKNAFLELKQCIL